MLKTFPKRTAAVVAFLFLFSSGNLFAEDVQREVETVRRETGTTRQIGTAFEKSEEKAKLDRLKTGVTYEDILKDPDNIDLNYRYAKEQIARGELVSASATLERILLIRPELADVRLLYAVVLYRLASLGEAQKELNVLKGMALPPKIKSEVETFQKKIKYKQRRTHFGLRESIGWGYDTNRNASPHSKQQLVNNVMQDVSVPNRRRPDTHLINVTSVDVTHDLGFQAGHTVFANFNYFLQEQTKVRSLSLGSYQCETGGTYKSKWLDFTPSFYFGYMYLSDQSFLRTQGGNFLFERDLTKKLNVLYDFRIERQDYMNISEDNEATDRKGPMFSNLWGLNYTILPTMRLSSSVGYSVKRAKQDYNAYDRISLNNTHTWIWPKGQFVINTFNVYFDNYDAPEFSIVSKIRHDRSIRYRATYGVPLETLLIGKLFPKPFNNIVFTISYEYYHALSSITNYTYTNNKIEGLFSKRWEF